MYGYRVYIFKNRSSRKFIKLPIRLDNLRSEERFEMLEENRRSCLEYIHVLLNRLCTHDTITWNTTTVVAV